MEEYRLREDEVLLYEGSVGCDGKTAALKLTTAAIVLTTKEITGKLLHKTEQINVRVISIEEIKTYHGAPQIKQKVSEVSLQTVGGDLTLRFDNLLKARKFMNKAIEAATGKTAALRGSEKVRGAINVVDTALGIDTMGTVRGVLENGVVGSLLTGSKKKKGKGGAVLQTIEAVSSAVVTKQPKQTEMTLDERVDALKKYKELADGGVISEEEFAAKKKELMGE